MMGPEISEPTRHKHHRSQPSDDDSENPSKRRKHHSHKHHHEDRRRRHRRSIKDPNDDAGGDDAVSRIDHDHMEEGEIVESSRYRRHSHSHKSDRHHSRKTRESDRDKHREKKRERSKDSDMRRYEDNSRHSKYNDNDDDYRRRRHDKDAEMTDSFNADLPERDCDTSMRDEDEHEDNLAENEEDELEKIKEESRRRRQAILEKYKSQNLQQVQNVKEEHPPLTAVKSPPRLQQVKHEEQPKQSVKEEHPHLTASNASNDMFSVSDDIFGESPCKPVKRNSPAADQKDNWDDAEGYYSYRFGEVIDGQYEIIAAHGKGVFSTVHGSRKGS